MKCLTINIVLGTLTKDRSYNNQIQTILRSLGDEIYLRGLPNEVTTINNDDGEPTGTCEVIEII